MNYRPRTVDARLQDQLRVAGAVLLRGPKGCGKTATARFHSHSEVVVDDSPAIEAAMATDPAVLLRGDTPRLIDEWQEQPRLWNTIRHEVDRRQQKGQFILTGSSTPRDAELAGLHSGVGRFGILRLNTMSWFERGWSSGEVSLAAVLRGEEAESEIVETDLETLTQRLVIGGWPGNLEMTVDDAQAANDNYYDLLTESDVSRAAGGHRDPYRIRRTMSSLARNIATEADNTVIMRDTAIDDTAVSRSTVLDYLQVLERLMIIENLPAWRTHIRSAATLRKAPKRHFCDPSVACMALGLSPDRLLEDLEYTGFLFESAVIHDLRVYAQALGGQLYHYRDSNRWEADAIIELRDGSWAPVEVKLGFGAVGEAAASVSRVADNVDQSKTGPLLGKLVITGSGFAHRRPDGVTVVPLAVLGP